MGRDGVILNNAVLGGGGGSNILNGNDGLRNESLLGTEARILAKVIKMEEDGVSGQVFG